MNDLSIERSLKTPGVFYDKNNQLLFIGGRSLPEHPAKFYDVIFDWLVSYFRSNSGQSLEIVVMLEYCNTTSSKVILDLFGRLGKILPNKNSCNLKWYYENDDPDMRDIAEIIFSEKIIEGEIIGVAKLEIEKYLHP